MNMEVEHMGQKTKDPSEYITIIAEVYFDKSKNKNEVRPCAGQPFPQDMRISCAMRIAKYTPGTKVRLKVVEAETNRKPYLYSSYRWKHEKVPDKEFDQVKGKISIIKTDSGVSVRKSEKQVHPPIPKGKIKPKAIATEIIEFQRDALVKSWVLQQANGKCECCNETAPFSGPDGLPYLEVHHVRQLADNGSDTTSNAVALCPNCHREFHYGANSTNLVARLYKRISRLVHE